MSGRRFTRWVLPLLMLGVLLLLLLLILYPVQIQRRPELLEMSVIAREADGSAWATARQGTEQAEGMELGLVFAADRPGRGKGQSGLLRQAHRQSGPLLGGELPEQLRL